MAEIEIPASYYNMSDAVAPNSQEDVWIMAMPHRL